MDEDTEGEYPVMLPVLHVSGKNIVDAAGKTVRLPGYAAFALFKRFLMPNGWNALVIPNLTEYRSIATAAGYPTDGPIALRVFRHAGGANAFAMDPWSYTQAQVTSFATACAQLNFIIDWTAGDYQLCFPGPNPLDGPKGIHEHHNVFCAGLVGVPSIWNVSNEPFKNGLRPSDAVPPPWAPSIQYTGDYGDDRDTSTDLNCVNLHTDRSEEGGAPKWVGKAHESAPYLWKYNKPIFYDEGMGADEDNIPGRRSNVPQYFGIMGSVIAAVSSVYFHSTDGLACNGFRPKTKECAVEFWRGAVGGLLVRS